MVALLSMDEEDSFEGWMVWSVLLDFIFSLRVPFYSIRIQCNNTEEYKLVNTVLSVHTSPVWTCQPNITFRSEFLHFKANEQPSSKRFLTHHS